MSNKAFTTDLNDKPEYQRLLDAESQTHGMRSGRVFVEPGKSCGQHSTKDHEELLVFLTGQAQVAIGEDQILQAGQGKIAYIPPRTQHDVKNTGDGPLTYIYCVAPVNLEE
mgnify:CR=1 FL=1